MDYKHWTRLSGFSREGYPLLARETETVELSHFQELFISYLAEVLPGLDEDPSLRYRQFREIYVDCLLTCQHEYSPDCELPP